MKGGRKVHFTVVCLVTWPMNESEAGVDLVLIETSLLFLFYEDKALTRSYSRTEPVLVIDKIPEMKNISVES